MSGLSAFGQRVKLLRQENNLSQRDFAERIGVTASALSSYEKAQKNPSVNVAVNIAREFGVTLDWLCGLVPLSNRFKPSLTIPFDLPTAIFSLESLLLHGIITIPHTTNDEGDWVSMDESTLNVRSPVLRTYLRDLRSLNDLYGNGAISGDNLRICIEEMTYRTASAIREEQEQMIADMADK